jgi:murein DD-endopeptidase MepM/ murein hydrolase activator NlpD
MDYSNMFKSFLNKFFILTAIITLIVGFFDIGKVNITQAEEGGEAAVSELSDQIKDKQNAIDELRKKIDVYEENLATERSKSDSLKNQIYILQTQIDKKEAEIQLTEDEMGETALQIEMTEGQIKDSELQIKDKQDKIARFLREIYRQDDKSDLEIIVMNSSIADFFNQLRATSEIQNEINDNLIEVKELKVGLETEKKNLEEKKVNLEYLANQLEGRKGGLEEQQYTKQYLLNQTRNSEAKYQQLVDELKAEQNKINSEIVALEKTMRSKLSGSDRTKLEELGDTIFAWPVPGRVITATFHDPDYPFRHIFEHPAIDIRAKQGTPLQAAASGYVAKVKDGGKYGYSYIMLIHNDGFATVYGHVSAIYVEADQFVTQGEVIGATGGTPGTHGAGPLTTGPHLHFEIRKDGIPVNPLEYLP